MPKRGTPLWKRGAEGGFSLPKRETRSGEGTSDSSLPVRICAQTGLPTLILEEPVMEKELCNRPFGLSLSKAAPRMVRQAHHERT